MPNSRVKENNSPNYTTMQPTRGKSMATMKDGKVTKPQKSAMFVGLDNYTSTVSEESDGRPFPTDFPEFLPWACNALSVGKFVNIIVVQQDDTSVTRREKAKQKAGSLQQQPSEIKEIDETSGGLQVNPDDIIVIEATYKGLNLLQIKFIKSKQIPRKLMKIIGLIIKFYPSLERIIINSGLTGYITHEISNFLPLSNITEIILDNCFIVETNFHIFFDRPNSVKMLSLARCAIGDKGVKEIFQKLVYPLPGSTTLSILNLSSNKITDTGAGYIANVLRSNRRLKYLNLAGNRLTDIGGNKIISTLMPFVLAEEERQAYKQRYTIFLKNKIELIKQIFNSLTYASSKDTKDSKKKNVKTPDSRKVKTEIKKSETKTTDPEIQYMMEKAEYEATSVCGEFIDPFSENNTKVNDDKLYCNGNYALSYLNLSYNDLSTMTLKYVLKALEHQKYISINSGISNLYIEGNPMPRACAELDQIDSLLLERLSKRNMSRHSTTTQKKRWTNVK